MPVKKHVPAKLKPNAAATRATNAAKKLAKPALTKPKLIAKMPAKKRALTKLKPNAAVTRATNAAKKPAKPALTKPRLNAKKKPVLTKHAPIKSNNP